MPALCLIIAGAGAFFKKGKAQTMNKENMNTTPETFDIDEYRGFILQAFDHATDEMMNDETKAEAHELVKAYFGHDCGDSSPMLLFMSGFIIGMSKGMRIAETLNAAAAEKTTTQ